MKQSYEKWIPHKLKILIQSPGFQKILYNQGYFYKKYQQLKGFERFGFIFLITVFVMYIFKVLNQIGALSQLIVFIAGGIFTGVIIMPVMMLILRYKWKHQTKKMNLILKQNHLEKYSKQCFRISIKVIGKKKA